MYYQARITDIKTKDAFQLLIAANVGKSQKPSIEMIFCRSCFRVLSMVTSLKSSMVERMCLGFR